MALQAVEKSRMTTTQNILQFLEEHGTSSMSRLITHCGSHHEIRIALDELERSGHIVSRPIKGSLQREYSLAYGGAA